MPKGKSRKSNPELYDDPPPVEPASDLDLDDPAVIEMEADSSVPGEEIPTAVSADEPAKGTRGPKRSYKPRKPRKVDVKIPPQVLQAIGEAPFLLTGVVYQQRTGRSLDFNNPVEVAQMHQASLDAFAVWMTEMGIEAPPWLVWAGMTAMTLSTAIGIDIMRMKAAIQEKENLAAKARAETAAKATAAVGVPPNGATTSTGPAPVSLTAD